MGRVLYKVYTLTPIEVLYMNLPSALQVEVAYIEQSTDTKNLKLKRKLNCTELHTLLTANLNYTN